MPSLPGFTFYPISPGTEKQRGCLQTPVRSEAFTSVSAGPLMADLANASDINLPVQLGVGLHIADALSFCKAAAVDPGLLHIMS